MEWFNLYGLIFIIIIMIPKIIFAIKYKNRFKNNQINILAKITEQIGRFGCIAFMIINIPGITYGCPTQRLFSLYIVINSMLIAIYCAIWVICFQSNSTFKALALSIIPSVIFIFSGIITRSIPLIIASIIFVPSHIYISYHNSIKKANT